MMRAKIHLQSSTLFRLTKDGVSTKHNVSTTMMTAAMRSISSGSKAPPFYYFLWKKKITEVHSGEGAATVTATPVPETNISEGRIVYEHFLHPDDPHGSLFALQGHITTLYIYVHHPYHRVGGSSTAAYASLSSNMWHCASKSLSEHTLKETSSSISSEFATFSTNEEGVTITNSAMILDGGCSGDRPIIDAFIDHHLFQLFNDTTVGLFTPLCGGGVTRTALAVIASTHAHPDHMGTVAGVLRPSETDAESASSHAFVLMDGRARFWYASAARLRWHRRKQQQEKQEFDSLLQRTATPVCNNTDCSDSRHGGDEPTSRTFYPRGPSANSSYFYSPSSFAPVSNNLIIAQYQEQIRHVSTPTTGSATPDPSRQRPSKISLLSRLFVNPLLLNVGGTIQYALDTYLAAHVATTTARRQDKRFQKEQGREAENHQHVSSPIHKKSISSLRLLLKSILFDIPKRTIDVAETYRFVSRYNHASDETAPDPSGKKQKRRDHPRLVDVADGDHITLQATLRNLSSGDGSSAAASTAATPDRPHVWNPLPRRHDLISFRAAADPFSFTAGPFANISCQLHFSPNSSLLRAGAKEKDDLEVLKSSAHPWVVVSAPGHTDHMYVLYHPTTRTLYASDMLVMVGHDDDGEDTHHMDSMKKKQKKKNAVVGKGFMHYVHRLDQWANKKNTVQTSENSSHPVGDQAAARERKRRGRRITAPIPIEIPSAYAASAERLKALDVQSLLFAHGGGPMDINAPSSSSSSSSPSSAEKGEGGDNTSRLAWNQILDDAAEAATDNNIARTWLCGWNGVLFLDGKNK